MSVSVCARVCVCVPALNLLFLYLYARDSFLWEITLCLIFDDPFRIGILLEILSWLSLQCSFD